MIIISRKDLIGIWKLFSMESQTLDGAVIEEYKWIGRLRYDEKGYMSVQLMDLNRPHIVDEESSEEVKKAFETYNAYFGTYDVNQEEGSVTHHLEGAMYPNWTKIDLKRFFNLFNNTLELITSPMQEGNTEVIWRLIWERLD